MAWAGAALLWLAAVVATLLAATLAFDVVHWTLHRWMHSRRPLLRRLGGLHGVHHRFLGADLRLHPEWQRANLTHHVLPEYATHVAFTLALLWVLPAPVVLGVLALETAVAANILAQRGRDVNHRGWRRVPAHRPQIFCLPAYHAWHHVHPDAFFSSWIKPLDFLLGTGTALAGRSAAVTAGALGDAFARELRGAGARVVRLPDSPADAARLADVDLLVLAGGAAGADDAFAEALCAARGARLLPPELWVAGSRPARRRFDPRLIRRRVRVRGGVAPERAARLALARIRRGLHHVAIGAGRSALAGRPRAPA